jgi:hypothetical protein
VTKHETTPTATASLDMAYVQGEVAALREHYEGKLREQAETHRRRAEHDLEVTRDLQAKLLREQDLVLRLQRKLLAVRALFDLEEQ